MSANKGKSKTVEGCIARQQSDFVVYTKKGKAMRVSGQDLTAHVGHLVKLHGTEQNASGSAASGSSNMGGTSGAAASGSMGQTGSTAGTSGSMGSNTAGASGSMAGSTDQSASSGSMGSSGMGSASSNISNKELVVDRVEHVADTCPANIQDKINSSSGSSNPPSKY